MDLATHRVSAHAMYYKIATQHAEAYGRLDAEYESLTTRAVSEDELQVIERRTEDLYEKREQAAVVAITFSGMALEAFFYDYAASFLGDTYVQEHLDKLDLKSKYLVYPRLVCGKCPEKSATSYETLVRLVKLRNDLVHFKSKGFSIKRLGDAAMFHEKLNERLKAGVKDSVECVILVMRELDSLHGRGALFEQRMKWSLQ